LNYENILRSLGLPTLEYRRDRNDMIQVYRALRDIDNINWMKLFTLAPSNTRGHSAGHQRLHSFSIRVINQWNNLSNSSHHNIFVCF